MTWKLVKKACVDNEEPINGYVLNEISQTTLKGVKYAETAADQLLRRIKKKEPNVKLKALHTTNFVCKNGSPYFKTRIRNSVETIKDCLTYTCPLDNVRGETPFLAVRTMAHNVLEILYEDNLNNDQNLVSNISSQPNTGFGNEPIKNKNKNTNQSQNQPVLSVIQPQTQNGQTTQTGLGNSPLRMNKKFFKHKKKFEKKIVVGTPTKENSYYQPQEIQLSTSNNIFQSNQQQSSRRVKGVKNRFKINSLEQRTQQIQQTQQTQQIQQKQQTQQIQENQSYQNQQSQYQEQQYQEENEDNYEYEKKLVDEIIMYSGVRISPPKTKINGFIKKCINFEAEVIGKFVEEYLIHEKWQYNFRALCIIEALINAKYEDYIEYFEEEEAIELIESLIDLKKSMINKKVQKIFSLLNREITTNIPQKQNNKKNYQRKRN